MKRIFPIFGICSILFACGGETKNSTEETTASTNETSTSTSTVAGESKGEQLMKTSDCLTCHKTDAKIVGPSYIDVANKYDATDENIEMLVSKIINGGSGNWGEIPMAPHPSISKEDATEMVKYILSLKTN